MKSLFVFFTLSFLAVNSYAQESHIYVKAGVNLANVTITDNGKYSDANSLVSYHAGLGADLPLSKFFSVQPSLLFTGKGAKTAYGKTTDPYYFKATSKPYYVELPVNLVAKLPLATMESNFFIGAGPYIAVGVAGKNKAEGKALGNNFKRESAIEFSNDDPTTFNIEEGAGFGIVKRFDYGLNATAGFQFSSVLVAVNYGYGLAKLTSGSNSDNTNDNNKHRVLSLSLGVRL